MKYYELMFIVNGELSKELATEELEKFKSLVEEMKGSIVKVDEWGLKRFAYPINKKNTGYYFIAYLNADYQLVKEIERKFKINENIFRYLFVVLGDEQPKESKEPVESTES